MASRGKALAALLMVLVACGEAAEPNTTRPAPAPTGLLLASSFERPVCGDYWRPGDGCEFGIQGQVETVSCQARTGDRCVRIQRMAPPDSHMGVIAPVPLPEGQGFVGVAHRVPEIPPGAIPSQPGYLELEQISPTDGTLPGWPIEVRLHADRRLSLARFEAVGNVGGGEVFVPSWTVPVDEWFYVVVGVTNGMDAEQQMWVYSEDDRLVAQVSLRTDTQVEWTHQRRVAQKIGGVTSSEVPMYTYVDDWYVAPSFHGPLHIGPDGEPLAA